MSNVTTGDLVVRGSSVSCEWLDDSTIVAQVGDDIGFVAKQPPQPGAMPRVLVELRVVEELVRTGSSSLYRELRETVALPPPGRQMTGTFRLTPRGFGFITPDEPTEHGDLFVPAQNTHGAMTGDRIIAKVIHERARTAGGKLLAVCGPAVIHTGAGPDVAALVRDGWIDVLFAGNGFAVHDIESNLLGTSLGISIREGTPIEDATTIEDLKQYTFGAQAGTTGLTYIREVIQPDEQPNQYNDTKDAAQALANGQIDAVVIDVPIAITLTQEYEGTTVAAQFITNEGYGMVFEKGSPLVQCVNQALGEMEEDGTLKQLQDQWLPELAVDIKVIEA